MQNNEQKSKSPFYSVVIPTYNEGSKAKEMEEHLASIKEYFESLGQSYEVLVVLDGPTDNSLELVKKEAEKNPNIRIIDRKENKGKGYSVREGLLKSQGQIRLFTDMDGATPIKMFDRFLPKFQKGYDIVIGSRDLKDSQIKIHQPKWKEWLGDIGNLLIQLTTGLYGMKDTQCGFKAFSQKAVEDILPRTTVNRWGIDFEILMIGKKLGYRIAEAPVEWLDRGDSKVGISGYISTFKDLFYVKLNMLKGVYKLDKKISEIKK